VAVQQFRSRVCIPRKCCLFQRVVFADSVAIRFGRSRPAASELGGGPHPVEGLEQHVVSAGIQQSAVEVAVDGRPGIRIVGVALLFVWRRTRESVMCCAHPGFPIEVASLDREPQHGRLKDRPSLRELLPPIIGYLWNRKASVRQPLRQALSHEPQKRLSRDREADAMFVRQLLRTQGLPGRYGAMKHSPT
jgi:hypothetical protein